MRRRRRRQQSFVSFQQSLTRHQQLFIRSGSLRRFWTVADGMTGVSFRPHPPGLTVFASRSLASAKTKNKIVVVATKETSSLIFSGLRIAAGVVNFASFYSFLSSQYHGAAVSKRRLVLGPPSLSYLRDDGCVCLPSVRGDGGAPAAFHR